MVFVTRDNFHRKFYFLELLDMRISQLRQVTQNFMIKYSLLNNIS